MSDVYIISKLPYNRYTLFSKQGPRNITSTTAEPLETDMTTQKPQIFDLDLEKQKKADHKIQGKL